MFISAGNYRFLKADGAAEVSPHYKHMFRQFLLQKKPTKT